MDLIAFADEVGTEGPVVPVGGRTQWDVGGRPDAGAREVKAPAGIVEHLPAELVVRCGAGTTIAQLDATLAEHGQMVPLDAAQPEAATVGGVLAVGRSGIRRLRYGPVRDLLLEARYVSAAGQVVKAGGPVVKNVSGFDLARLLVGSLGTVGILAQVVLRARPRPRAARWLAGPVDPFALRRRLVAPSCVLWDGTTTWVLLEGHPGDVDAEATAAGPELAEVDGPPPIPSGGRLSWRPSALRQLDRSTLGAFVAEIGVGVVHMEHAPTDPPSVEHVALHAAVKARFDPTGRLNPGRSVVPS